MTLLVANRHMIISDNLSVNGRLPIVKSKLLRVGSYIFAITGDVETGELMIDEFINSRRALVDPGNTIVLVCDMEREVCGQLNNLSDDKGTRTSYDYVSPSLSMMGDGWRSLQIAVDLFVRDVLEIDKAAEVFESLWIRDCRTQILDKLRFEVLPASEPTRIVNSRELILMVAEELYSV